MKLEIALKWKPKSVHFDNSNFAFTYIRELGVSYSLSQPNSQTLVLMPNHMNAKYALSGLILYENVIKKIRNTEIIWTNNSSLQIVHYIPFGVRPSAIIILNYDDFSCQKKAHIDQLVGCCYGAKVHHVSAN